MSRRTRKKRAAPQCKSAAGLDSPEKLALFGVGTSLAESLLKLAIPAYRRQSSPRSTQVKFERTTLRKERTMPEESNTVDILDLHRRAQARERNQRIGSAAAGLILSAAAALAGRGKKSLTSAVLATAGGLLIARGVSGLSVKQLSHSVRKLFTHRTDLEKRFNDGEHDIVDAASFDSFPASDPPSYSPGIG